MSCFSYGFPEFTFAWEFSIENEKEKRVSDCEVLQQLELCRCSSKKKKSCFLWTLRAFPLIQWSGRHFYRTEVRITLQRTLLWLKSEWQRTLLRKKRCESKLGIMYVWLDTSFSDRFDRKSNLIFWAGFCARNSVWQIAWASARFLVQKPMMKRIEKLQEKSPFLFFWRPLRIQFRSQISSSFWIVTRNRILVNIPIPFFLV